MAAKKCWQTVKDLCPISTVHSGDNDGYAAGQWKGAGLDALKHKAIAVRLTAQTENFRQITVDYVSEGKGGFLARNVVCLHDFRRRQHRSGCRDFTESGRTNSASVRDATIPSTQS